MQFNIEKAPKNIQNKIMMDMSYDDLKNMCKTNQKYSKICSDQNFWKQKTLYDFKNFSVPISDDINWEKVYLIFARREKLLLKFNFSRQAYDKVKKDFEDQENSILFNKYTSDWIYEEVVSRIDNLSQQRIINRIYGSYKADYADTIYPFIIYISEKGKIMVKIPKDWVEYDDGQTIGRFHIDLKRIIYLTDPLLNEQWSEIDEYFRPLQVPIAGKLQPYYYFHSPKNILYKPDDYIFNDTLMMDIENDKDNEIYDSFSTYYKKIFNDQPEYVLFSNNLDENYMKYPNDLNMKIIIDILADNIVYDVIVFYEDYEIMGNYLGTPFIIYFKHDKVKKKNNDQNLYIKIASSNVKPLINKLYTIFSNIQYE